MKIRRSEVKVKRTLSGEDIVFQRGGGVDFSDTIKILKNKGFRA